MGNPDGIIKGKPNDGRTIPENSRCSQNNRTIQITDLFPCEAREISTSDQTGNKGIGLALFGSSGLDTTTHQIEPSETGGLNSMRRKLARERQKGVP